MAAVDGEPRRSGPLSPSASQRLLRGALRMIPASRDEGSRLWGLCDRRPAAAIGAEMAAWLRARDRPADGVGDYLERLVSLGLVTAGA